MPTTEVTSPSGNIIYVDHLEGATDDDIFNAARNFDRTTDDRGTLLGNAAKTFLSGGIEAAINVGAGGAQITAMGIDILDGEMDGINPNMGESVQIMSDVAQRWRDISTGVDERMGIDPQFAESFGGQVLSGLGQMPVNIAASIAGGVAGAAIGTAVGGPAGAVAGATIGGLTGGGLVIAPQMTTEAILDAERTLNKKYSEFSNEEMDDAALSALGYTVLGGALEYVGLRKAAPLLKGLEKKLPDFVRGKIKLTSKEIKSLSKEISEGFAVEGFTEAAQGQLLDTLSRATYDDDRELMSFNVLANRFNEFLVGGIVGGTTAGATGLFTKREQDVQNQNTKPTGANSFDVVVVDDASGREFIIPIEAAANEEEAIKIAQEGLDAYETKSPDLTFTVTGATPSQGRVEQVIEEPEAQPDKPTPKDSGGGSKPELRFHGNKSDKELDKIINGTGIEDVEYEIRTLREIIEETDANDAWLPNAREKTIKKLEVELPQRLERAKRARDRAIIEKQGRADGTLTIMSDDEFGNQAQPEAQPAPTTTQRIPVDITDPDLIAYIEFLQQDDPQGGDIIAGASTPAVPFTNEQVLREAKFKKNDPRIIKKLGNEPLPRGGVRLNLNSAFTLPNGQRGMLQTVHPMSSTGRVNYSKAHSYGSAYIVKDGKLSVSPLGRAVIGYGLNSKFPMASVDGDIVGTEPNLEANEILTFNPFGNSSFVDSRGRPVESFKGEGTVHGSKVYVRGTLNYAKQEPVRFTQKDMLDYLSGKTVKGEKLSLSKIGIKGKDFLTDSDKAKEIRRMKKVVREKGELPFDSIQEDIVAGASTPTVSQETTVSAARLTADAIINASDQVIDAPISVETDPGEGGKVRSIGKMYLLPESEVLDFKDNNNIAPAAKRISKVLDLAFKQFPKFSKWYSSRLKMAMNILQQLDSDLKKPQDQFIVKVLLAITSNGNEVSPQTEESYRIYQYWKENNSIAVPSTQGTREGALLNHLKLVDDIIKKHGWKKLKTFMDKSGTVKDLRKEMQNTFGFTSKEASQITGGELVSEAVPFSLILGPKLGSFYNNLNGNFDTTTMDRWFMRTFGRTLGQQFLRQDNTEKTERFLNATNSILADPEYADILDQRILKTKETTVRDLLPKGDQVNSSDLKRLSIFFSKEKNRLIGGVKIEKSAPLLDELRLATNGLFKVGDSLAMLEAPKNGSHRRFIRRVMEQSLSDFNKANNLNFTPAEAQALLWYYEKLIHDSHGSRQKDEAPDYGSAANTLHRKITGRDSTRYRASDAVRRRGDVQPSGAVVSAAQQPSPPTGRRPESVGAAQPTSEQNTGQTQEEIVAGGFLGDFFDAGLNPPVDNSMRTPQERRIEPTNNVNPEGYANERELEQAIEDEFGPIAKALGLARIIINTGMGLAASYNVTRNTIQFNPRLLIGQSKEYVRAAMREEIIHAVTHEVIKKQGGSWLQFFGQVGRDMNPKERRAVSDVYPNLKEDYDFGAEFYRMIIQQGSYGQITEQFSRNGPAMSKIQKLLKKVQSYMARLLKTIAGEKYQADVMIAQSAALLAQVDPSARPTNQKVIEEATESIAIQTGQREITAGVAAEINTPPSKKKNKEKLSFMDKYVNTVSRVLSKINPRIAQAFQSYFNTIEAEKNDAIKRVLPFVQKYNAIKSKADKDRLKQLLMYSPLKQDEQPKAELIAERDALLRKYDMYNDLIFGVQPVLSRLRSNAREQGIDVGFLESFFPRRVIDYKGLKDSLGETIADDINLALEQRNAEIETENIAIMERNSKLQPGQKGENLIPKIEKNSPEEALFIEDYIRKAGTSEQFLKNRGISIKIPREELSRRFELIQKEQLEFYDDVPSALESYITNMIVATRTTELMGRRYEELDVTLDPTFEKVRTPGTLSPIISELLESGEIDAEDVKTVRNIARMILNPAAKENPLLSGMRQASYISTLVEFTSTLSQLFDMPFVMYRNGLINTVRGLGMTRDFSLESFGYAKDRVSDEFTDERSFLNSAAKFGLKAVGFTKLDQIMKESNLAASYLQLRKLSRGYYKNRDSKASKKFRLEIEQYNGAENVDATIAALKKGDRDNALVRNLVFAQLLKTQPMSKMQSVAAQSANPNVRFVYQMKSFMIAQLAYTRQEIFDDLFGSNSTTKQRAVALSNLTKLMGFMLLVGLPVDALKDFLAGRLGYLDDYLLNGMVRSFGISKYQFYQIKREGLGQAFLDFITPITVQQGVDYTAELQRVMSGDKALTESKLVSIAPASDVINRLFGFTREKEMKEYRRRLKEGDVPFIRPPGSL